MDGKKTSTVRRGGRPVSAARRGAELAMTVVSISGRHPGDPGYERLHGNYGRLISRDGSEREAGYLDSVGGISARDAELLRDSLDKYAEALDRESRRAP